jgi:hypothetical protein
MPRDSSCRWSLRGRSRWRLPVGRRPPRNHDHPSFPPRPHPRRLRSARPRMLRQGRLGGQRLVRPGWHFVWRSRRRRRCRCRDRRRTSWDRRGSFRRWIGCDGFGGLWHPGFGGLGARRRKFARLRRVAAGRSAIGRSRSGWLRHGRFGHWGCVLGGSPGNRRDGAQRRRGGAGGGAQRGGGHGGERGGGEAPRAQKGWGGGQGGGGGPGGRAPGGGGTAGGGVRGERPRGGGRAPAAPRDPGAAPPCLESAPPYREVRRPSIQFRAQRRSPTNARR